MLVAGGFSSLTPADEATKALEEVEVSPSDCPLDCAFVWTSDNMLEESSDAFAAEAEGDVVGTDSGVDDDVGVASTGAA